MERISFLVGDRVGSLLHGRKAREGLNFIGDRFPHRSEVVAVLGVAVFVCHSWTTLGFLNKLPSFMLYFTLGEIAGIFSYMMAFALLESLAVAGFLALLSAILPSSWLRAGFAFKGFVFITIATAASILFQNFLGADYPSTLTLAISTIIPLALIVILIGVVQSMPKLQNLVLSVQDRISVMLFVYVPIGLISLIVVVFRTL